jgi:hypothetical protein
VFAVEESEANAPQARVEYLERTLDEIQRRLAALEASQRT